MTTNPLDLFGRASEWTLDKVRGATDQLGATTPCDDWNVRQLMDHMLETQRYFVGSAKGDENAKPPGQEPPDIIREDSDPGAIFEAARAETLKVFGEDGVIERTGPSIGIAFADQLLHGWDLATATGQDATMPAGLPEAAYEMIHGQFTEEQRKGVFKPEVKVDAQASAQDRLLAYTGRTPAG
jgi:uncharacterized protein (TIGR03086 family)